MKLNEKTVINGNLVILVPYEHYHVPKYHEWMKSKELQILTASEPLSLEEEYSMQNSWRTDSDKCTFIILDKQKYSQCQNEIEAMVGDTNLFLAESDGKVAEVEIMIAETSARRKGLGKEAVLSMIRFGIEELKLDSYQAKIRKDNHNSILMFEKLGFKKICENKVFEEILYQLNVTETWINWLLSQTKSYSKEERKR